MSHSGFLREQKNVVPAILACSFHRTKVIGGLYLLYLGFRALFGLPSVRHADSFDSSFATAQEEPLADIVRQGFLVELMNPKTVLFFLAFLPGFVDEDAGNIGLQMLILGLLIPLTAIPTDVSVSLAASTLTDRLRAKPRSGFTLELISALILIALGIRVLWSV